MYQPERDSINSDIREFWVFVVTATKETAVVNEEGLDVVAVGEDGIVCDKVCSSP